MEGRNKTIHFERICLRNPFDGIYLYSLTDLFRRVYDQGKLDYFSRTGHAVITPSAYRPNPFTFNYWITFQSAAISTTNGNYEAVNCHSIRTNLFFVACYSGMSTRCKNVGVKEKTMFIRFLSKTKWTESPYIPYCYILQKESVHLCVLVSASVLIKYNHYSSSVLVSVSVISGRSPFNHLIYVICRRYQPRQNCSKWHTYIFPLNWSCHEVTPSVISFIDRSTACFPVLITSKCLYVWELKTSKCQIIRIILI